MRIRCAPKHMVLTMRQRIYKYAVNTFVITYVFVLTWWLLYPTPLRTAILKPFVSPVVYFGLWQGWGVFSPNIRRTDVTLGANITYDDGMVYTWGFPRIDKCGLIEKMYMERYRKFGYDHANWDDHSYMWNDFSRYIGRINRRSGKKIVSIELFKTWCKLCPMEQALRGERNPEHFSRYYVYHPSAEDRL